MLFHTNFENPIISKYQTNITNFENQNEEQKNEESKAGGKLNHLFIFLIFF